LAALGVVVAVLATACARSDGQESEAGRRSVPRSLSRAESAAEDTIDLAVAGRRDKAVRSARSLDTLVQRDLAEDLEGIATKEELGQLQARAAELAKIAPSGDLIAVALAANHAFELIARLFGKFESDVPARVLTLDYLDFEAKLRALSREIDLVRATVTRLASTWSELSKTFPSGDKAAAARGRFESHVAAMTSLATVGTDFDGMAKEAQHGLDLVDELEEVYRA
jgi:vacuolar-type H+-ATPase subunit E/Vma4